MDVFSDDETWRQRLGHAEPFHGLECGDTVDAHLGVGDGEVLERSVAEYFALVVHHSGGGAPEDESADGVGEAAFGNGQPFLLQAEGRRLVGRDEYLEGCAVLDLGVELADRAKGQDDFVAGRFFKLRSDFFHRAGKIPGDGDPYLLGMHGSEHEESAGDQQAYRCHGGFFGGRIVSRQRISRRHRAGAR